jgi:2-polyprenyl-3-methyl-5-hydroxy-6-metoxy-1,4-benzoquinol methylase
MLMHENPNQIEREMQNRWADGYDAIFYQRPVNVGSLEDFREFVERKISERFAHLDTAQRRRLRILDAGCGTGELLSQLRSLGYTNLYGLDVADNMIEMASRKCPEVTFTVGPFDSSRLPIPQFDVIIGTAWLHHVPFLRPIFQRAYDLLSPGGIFVAMEPNNSWLFQQVGLRQSVMTLLFGPVLHIFAFKNKDKIRALTQLEGDRGYTSWHRHLSIRELDAGFDGLGFDVQIESKGTLVAYFAGQLFNSASDLMMYRFLRWLDRNFVDRMGRGGYLLFMAAKR